MRGILIDPHQLAVQIARGNLEQFDGRQAGSFGVTHPDALEHRPVRRERARLGRG
jgi:hypothetical protein